LTFPRFQGLLPYRQRTRQLKLPAQRVGLPVNVVTITRSAFFPVPAYRQEGGASSRLARGWLSEDLRRKRFKNQDKTLHPG
jgi:hypothetical protein